MNPLAWGTGLLVHENPNAGVAIPRSSYLQKVFLVLLVGALPPFRGLYDPGTTIRKKDETSSTWVLCALQGSALPCPALDMMDDHRPLLALLRAQS
ncbi:hypothetical protein CLAIMM_15040 [Cladophialophora immunda]|nr:hypothetical protein CLAIMM_15040 [Cladophialophora immunda]